MTTHPAAALSTPQVQAQTKRGDFFRNLTGMKDQLAVALPSGFTAERFARIVWTTWQRTPAIQQCTNASVLAATIQAAQLGLEPDGTLGLAYLVPYGNQCQLIVGYKGLIELARRSGLVASVRAEVVRVGDYFHYELGLEPTLKHIPAEVLGLEPTEIQERALALEKLAGTNGRHSTIVAAYAVVQMRDGARHFKVVTHDYVRKVRAASRGSSHAASPWNAWEEQMWMKTAIKVVLKFVPLSPEDRSKLDAAIGAHVDERVYVKLDDRGQILAEDETGQPVETTPAALDAAAPPPERSVLDQLVAEQGGEPADKPKGKGKRGGKGAEGEAQGRLVE